MTKTLPANFLAPGRTIHIRFGGIYSTDGTQRSIAFTIKLGSTTVFNGTFQPALSISANGEPWWGEAIIQCRTAGATGTVTAQMIIHTANDNGTVAMTTWGLSSQMSQTTINTTTSQALDILSTWSAANASNSWTTNWAVARF